MVTEALLYRLKELRGRLANLVVADRNNQMGNERYMRDGSHAQIAADIAGVKTQLRNWFGSNPLVIHASNERQINVASDDGGKSFGVRVMDLSRPGVLKAIEFRLDGDSILNLVEYLGGRQVVFQGQHVDSVSAFSSLETLVGELSEKLRLTTTRAVTAEEKYRLLDEHMKARFADAQ